MAGIVAATLTPDISQPSATEVFLQLLTRGQQGNPVMFFIHGWPDTGKLWLAQLEYFSKTHFCAAQSQDIPQLNQRNSAPKLL